MLNKLLAATAVAVLAYAVSPADAAQSQSGLQRRQSEQD